jgi:hypothetical protein
MPENTYKLIEIVGVSDESVQQAIRNGLAKASRTLRNLDWFEVTKVRGAITNNRDPVFQVEMKVGFRLAELPVTADRAHAEQGDTKAKKKKKKAKA